MEPKDKWGSWGLDAILSSGERRLWFDTSKGRKARYMEMEKQMCGK